MRYGATFKTSSTLTKGCKMELALYLYVFKVFAVLLLRHIVDNVHNLLTKGIGFFEGVCL